MRSAAASGLSVREAVGEALDFARDAWRDAFAPMALCILGWTAITVAGIGGFLDHDAMVLRRVGLGLLVFILPLAGALFRAGVGGRALRGIGPGGLQVSGVEGRLAAVALLFGLGLLACAAPFAGVGGLFYLALRRLGVVHLGPLGGWAAWFLASAAVCGAALVGIAYLLARLSLLSPIATAEGRIAPRRAWALTEGAAWTLVKAWLVLHVPTVLALIADRAIGWIATDDLSGGAAVGPWPMWAAVALGLVTGGLYFALQAPLSVGLVTFAYDVLREDAAPATGAEHDPAPVVRPIPEPDERAALDGEPPAAVESSGEATTQALEPEPSLAAPADAGEPIGAEPSPPPTKDVEPAAQPQLAAMHRAEESSPDAGNDDLGEVEHRPAPEPEPGPPIEAAAPYEAPVAPVHATSYIDEAPDDLEAAADSTLEKAGP